jgi:hypothetical protein
MFVFNNLIKYYELFDCSAYFIRVPGYDNSGCMNMQIPHMLLRRDPNKLKFQMNMGDTDYCYPTKFKTIGQKNLLHVYMCGRKNNKLSIETILYGSSTDIISIQVPKKILTYIKYRKFKKRNKVQEYFKKEQYNLDANFMKSIHMDMCCFADEYFWSPTEFMYFDIDGKNTTMNRWGRNYDIEEPL